MADRILQLSGIVPEREMRDRFLDRMDIEQERGITIKSQAVRVPWTFEGTEYTLGMIDTPGHVDFTYEVSRALAACEGAVLLDEHGERYMTRVDERAELAPRDVVARENFRVMQAQGGKPVMLDVSPMRRENPDLAEFLRHRFPTIDAYTRSLGFDWSKEPIPVAPAAHYYMGGIRTDLEGRASIPGLYAAGECARTGVMGSNRLASNSLLEGLVYGRRAGLAAVNDPAGSVWNPVWFSNSATGRIVSDTPVELSMPAPDERAGANGRPAIWDRTRIQNTMWAGVGVLRDGDGLRQAIDQLGTGLALADADATEPAATACEPDPITRLENRNLLTVGYVEANAALRRTESRGAHARTDYPESCDEWAQSIAYINA